MHDLYQERRRRGRQAASSVDDGAAYANSNPLFRPLEVNNRNVDASCEPSSGSLDDVSAGRNNEILPSVHRTVRPGTRDVHAMPYREGRGGSHRRQRSRSHSRDRHTKRRAPTRPDFTEQEDFDDGNTSELSFMKVIQPDRGDSASRIGGGSGGIGATSGGKEPAVKGCGIMTTTTFAKLVTILVMLYYSLCLWIVHYDSSTGKLCTFNKSDMCVTSGVSKALLTISRVSAGALFPSIVCCVLSKCYTTRYFLHHSWLALVVSFEPAHNLHTYFGVVTLICSVIHGVAHMARMFHEGDMPYMVHSTTDRSGLVALLLLFPTALPMWMGFLKTTFTYEFRKALHILFIPFMVAICFHTEALRYTGAVLLIWYLVDRLYFTTRMTFFIDRPTFKPVGRGTFVRFDLPHGYQFKVGSYIQVNCPAISATEWHPFSLFPVPGSRARAGFHVEAVGDWTQELFRLSLEQPWMPLWITAAQPSVIEKTVYFDNVLLVCTGAGITPAVSVADMFAKKKNIHLIWLSREASMIAMFEKQLRRVKSTVHLTGKPSAKTKQRLIDLIAPSRTEVVASYGRGSSRANSRSSSFSDLTTLEANGNAPSIREYRGEFRGGGDADHTTDDGLDDSVFGGSFLGGSIDGGSAWGGSALGRGPKGARQGGDTRNRPSGNNGKRPRGLHPVSLNFGRPDMERFITDTIQGTAVTPEWADESGMSRAPAMEEPPPSRLRNALGRQTLARLNTNQRISKRDLMSADLSVVGSDTAKGSSVTGSDALDLPQESVSPSYPVSADPGTWLVLYCGANAKVERAVATACDGLNVTWRKEYFSAW